jgi:hypothetical protein
MYRIRTLKTQLAIAVVLVDSVLLHWTTFRARADTLWYSGDFDSQAGYSNVRSTISSNATVMFERFDVTDGNGWGVTSLWSDNFSPDNSFFSGGVTQADWSIRTGMGTGNAGTILFGGIGSLTLTPTGRKYVTPVGTNLEYKLEITGLNVYLPPGEYWMNVTPYSAGGVAISSTGGANAIGTPFGGNDPGLWWWSDGGHNYDFVSRGTSMGVGGGVAIPEPSSLLLTAASTLLLWPFVKRRRAG